MMSPQEFKKNQDSLIENATQRNIESWVKLIDTNLKMGYCTGINVELDPVGWANINIIKDTIIDRYINFGWKNVFINCIGKNRYSIDIVAPKDK